MEAWRERTFVLAHFLERNLLHLTLDLGRNAEKVDGSDSNGDQASQNRDDGSGGRHCSGNESVDMQAIKRYSNILGARDSDCSGASGR